MGMVINKYEIWLVELDPKIGSEIKKTRPCIIISPDEINHNINTVIIAPMTTTIRNYPTRVEISFSAKTGQIALDQIRTIDKNRLIRKLGDIDDIIKHRISLVLQNLFSE